MLHQAGALPAAEVAEACSAWYARNFGDTLAFDVRSALKFLVSAGLATESADGAYRAVPLGETEGLVTGNWRQLLAERLQGITSSESLTSLDSILNLRPAEEGFIAERWAQGGEGQVDEGRTAPEQGPQPQEGIDG